MPDDAPAPNRPPLPDRLSIDPRSSHHDRAVFEHEIGSVASDHQPHDEAAYPLECAG